MENKTKYIIIAAVALILVVAIVIAVMVTSSKDKTDNTLAGESYAGEESDRFEPVSASDDVTVSFENMTTTMADEFEEHDLMTTLTTALHAESTTLENIITADRTTQSSAAGTTSASGNSAQNNSSSGNSSSGNQSSGNTSSGNTSSNNSSSNNSSSAERTTAQQYVEQTTSISNNQTLASQSVMRTINSFFTGKYYFDGTMVADGAQSPMEIAMDGNKFIFYSEMDGMDIGILGIENDYYLINPTSKKYTVLSTSLQNMMDLDMDSLRLDFNTGSFNGYQPTSVTEARYNGRAAVCYTYRNSQNHYDFVVVNGEIVQMIQYDSNGRAATVLHADEFTADFDRNMLSLNGYRKTNILSFVKDMMG